MTRTRPMTEQAADAAIDTACRVLRLPTIRTAFAGAADRPSASSSATAGSSPSCSWPSARTGTTGGPGAGCGRPGSPARSGCRTSSSMLTPPSAPPRSAPWPAATGSARACRSA
jgi:hypothetical protein